MITESTLYTHILHLYVQLSKISRNIFPDKFILYNDNKISVYVIFISRTVVKKTFKCKILTH